MVQIGIVMVLATVFTLPAVLLIPRQRQSPLFDRVLWVATWVLAVLGVYALPDIIGSDSPLNSILFAEMRIVSMGLGALAGAFSINILLWVLDRFSPSEIEEDPPSDVAPGEPTSSKSDELPH